MQNRRLGQRGFHRALLAVTTAVVVVTMSGCSKGVSAPAAIAVRCRPGSFHPAVSGDSRKPVTVPARAVAGIPRRLGSEPQQPSGYRFTGWTLSQLAPTGEKEWTIPVPRPETDSGHPSEYTASIESHSGYQVVEGGPDDAAIAAVSSSGKAGPVCASASSQALSILPGAGIAVTMNGRAWIEGHRVSDGKRAWARRGGEDGFDVAGGTLVTRDRGKIAAIDTRSGHQQWSTNAHVLGSDDDLSGPDSVSVFAGRVYALSEDNKRLTALDLSNGHVLWRLPLPASAASDTYVIRVASDLVAVTDTRTNRVRLVDAKTGAVLQNRSLAELTPSDSAAVRVDDRPVYVASGADRLEVLGAEARDNHTIHLPHGRTTDVITDTMAYVLVLRDDASPTAVFGYDLATGQRKWQVPAPAGAGQVIAHNGWFEILTQGKRTVRYG